MRQQLQYVQTGNSLQAFLIRLRSRNRVLYYFGWLNFTGACVCLLPVVADANNLVNNINAWIKPFKFFLSIGILSWTLTWLLVYLQHPKAVKLFTMVTVVTMVIEMAIITAQASAGKLSHFNISTLYNAALFSLMGIAITVFTLHTLYICILFFRQTNFPIGMTEGYQWGIRWGLLLFVLFAFEGGIMAALLQHSVGAADGTAGLPVLNWSKEAGDLRVAHFFGMHALQLLPFAGHYLAKKRWQIHLFSLGYFLFVVILLWQALEGYPII